MNDEHIYAAARLMTEQSEDFGRLETACLRLSEALIHGEPSTIDPLTRIGEVELLQMRARLVRLIQSLTNFAETRSSGSESNKLSPEARAAFESASNQMLEAARKFQRTRARTESLTNSGSTFATAVIEFCGIQPTTYTGPYSRAGESKSWA